MAQIIKHRRGSIDSLKGSLARKGELVIATGSIGNMNGPWVFVGDNDSAGAYKPTSQIYRGNTAPTISNLTYGSTLDGTPFYSITSKSLFILDSTGNAELDLTGNIEGNTISGVTINNLESTNVTASFISGAFYGDAGGLYNIPASGVTNLDLSRIVSGSATASISPDNGLEVNTHIRTTDNLYVTGTVYVGDNTDSQIYNDSTLFVQDHTNGVIIASNNYAELQSSDAWVWVEGSEAYVEGGTFTKVYTDSGNVQISAYDGGTLSLNADNGEGNINLGNNTNSVWGYTTVTNFAASDYAQLGSNNSYLWVDADGAYMQQDGSSVVGFTARPNGTIEATGSFNINGNTSVTGALYVADGSAIFDQALVAQNSNMLLTSGSNLIVQNNGNVQVDYIRGNSQEWNYLALNGNGPGGSPNVELGSTGDISLWAEGGTVSVTGSLRVTGDIVFSGSINLGDFTGDTINFNGEVSSSILPSTGSSFDLGSSGQTWANVYADTAHFANISLNTISFSGLTEGRVLLAGPDGSIVDSGSLTYGYNGDISSEMLTADSVRAANNGSGYNFQVGDDMWIGDVNQDSTMMFKGVQNENYAKVLLAAYSSNNFLEADNSDVKLQSDNNLRLISQNNHVYLESFDGTIYLNDDSGNNTRIGGDTYVYNGNLHVDTIWDYSDGSNYLQLYGWNTDDGYWWEGGNGNDTTLLNNYGGANLNILNTSSGNINVDATNGSVNIHTTNGMNVTGSLVVSDASGVFNSSLIAYNSNLTLDNGSNIEMNEGHIYFNNGCGDIYYNTGNNELTLFNDCGNIRFSNSTYTSNDMYFDDGNRLYTNYISDYNGNDLNINTDGGIYLYSDSTREIQLSTNNAEDGTNYFNVNNNNVYFSTYDYASDLTHKVLLDNTGSLKLENVALQLSGSLNVDGNTRFNNNLTIGQDLYVSGNFQVLGTGSIITLTGSQIDIGTNLINLNTYAPFERFAGINVFDSGSNVGVTGSLLWDSQNDVWIYANPSGSNYASARFIAGPKNTGSLGEEEGLTVGHFPIATGDDHISDSLLTYQGTELALNTNKFTVDSDSGDTLIHGNFTIEGVGGVDNEGYSSYIVFRNSDNVLGFVDTTDTENVTDRLLGYNESTGTLEFSSLIDGGTY